MRRLVAILFSLLAAATQALGADVADADAKGARAVIQAQLKAFATDDAKSAFSFATPQLREVFGSPENFIAMVRRSYPVVYRPASVAFLKPELDGDAVTQAVHLTDADGRLWLALYRLERQPDMRWRIGACQVVVARGQVT